MVVILKQSHRKAKGIIQVFQDVPISQLMEELSGQEVSEFLDYERPAVERSAFQCCHCNAVCIVRPGSGVERGYCFRCDNPTCGAERCISCAPFEAKLEAMEGRIRFHKQLGGY